jgi:hypothetical protein
MRFSSSYPKYDDGLDADGYPLNTSPGWRFVYGCEADAGDFRPIKLAEVNATVVDRLRRMFDVSPECESPIEVQLGAAVIGFFERAGVRLTLCNSFNPQTAPSGLLFVPQFKWSYYRSDWAIVSAQTHGALLIECDGAAWHSSEKQKAHDARKDQSALDYGFTTLRFKGSEIHRNADECAQKIYDAILGG